MKPTDLSIHVTSFLTHYLAAQRNLSPNTIKAYRDVFTLLLRFCRDVQGIVPEKLRLEHVDVSLIEAFLDHLATERKSSPRSEIIGLLLCTRSSDMFRPKIRPTCFSAKRSSRFPYDGTLVQRSHTFRKKNWLRFWRSRTCKLPRVGEMPSY